MTGPAPLFAMTAGRGAGKTTALVQWLLEGQLDAGNRWTRSLVVADGQRVEQIRNGLRDQLATLYPEPSEHVERVRRAVYDAVAPAGDWARRVRGAYTGRDLEIAVDDAETVLAVLLGSIGIGAITHLTINGETWPVPEPR